MYVAELLKLNKKISLSRALQIVELFKIIEDNFESKIELRIDSDSCIIISWNNSQLFYFKDGTFSYVHNQFNYYDSLRIKDTKDYNKIKTAIDKLIKSQYMEV